jgi:uncharacterized RDD family membrane protein YckC
VQVISRAIFTVPFLLACAWKLVREVSMIGFIGMAGFVLWFRPETERIFRKLLPTPLL